MFNTYSLTTLLDVSTSWEARIALQTEGDTSHNIGNLAWIAQTFVCLPAALASRLSGNKLAWVWMPSDTCIKPARWRGLWLPELQLLLIYCCYDDRSRTGWWSRCAGFSVLIIAIANSIQLGSLNDGKASISLYEVLFDTVIVKLISLLSRPNTMYAPLNWSLTMTLSVVLI